MWRRLIELRVFPEVWVITPSFAERLVRLSYPWNDGIQSVLSAQSPASFPVQVANVKAFSLKDEKDVFELAENIYPDEALAFRAIPRNYRSRESWCRVLVEVADKPPTSGSDQDEAQNTLLAQHSQQLTDLQLAIAQLQPQPLPTWQDATLQGWSNIGTPAGYLKHQGVVWIRGFVQQTGGTETIFTLPEGYRPEYDQFLLTASSFGLATLIITSAGAVAWGGTGGGGIVLEFSFWAG